MWVEAFNLVADAGCGRGQPRDGVDEKVRDLPKHTAAPVLSRVSSKSVKKECPARVSSKSVKQECQARGSSKSVKQECQESVSSKRGSSKSSESV